MNLRQYLLVVWLVVLASAVAVGVSADTSVPAAPATLTPGQSSSFQMANYDLKTTEAEAGNITALVIYAIGQTKAWQGFYGNISGTITLDDANNFTFYNWTAMEPRGQVYATLNNSIAWDQVVCFDYASPTLNLASMNTFYGIQPNAADAINVTYAQNDHTNFTVGFRNMTGCPTTYIFQNDVEQEQNFVNVLLWDISNNDTGWIYTTLIEDKDWNSVTDKICYNGEECDFQILVNENGFGEDVSTTTYYFWVELV